MNLLENAVFTRMIESTGAPSSTAHQSSIVLDMRGFTNVCFVGSVSAVTAGGVIRLNAMHSDSTSTTDMVSCTGANDIAQTTSATTDHDGQLLILDVRPSKPYVSVYLHRATQVSTVDVTAIQYNPKAAVTSQSTGTGGVIDSQVAAYPST